MTFTDFIMFREQAEVVSRYKLLETQTLAQYSDDVELIFIELPKFKIALEALESIHDKWIYFVKHAGRLDYVPDTLMMEPCINEAFGIANKAGLTEAELEAQEKRHDFIRLQRGAIEKALHDGLAKGREEGLKQGIEQGREAERCALILQAYKNGMPTHLIGSFVGMEEDAVIELLRQLLD